MAQKILAARKITILPLLFLFLVSPTHHTSFNRPRILFQETLTFLYSPQPPAHSRDFLPRNHYLLIKKSSCWSESFFHEKNLFFKFSFVISNCLPSTFFVHRFLFLSEICFLWQLNSFFNIPVCYSATYMKCENWNCLVTLLFSTKQTPLLLLLYLIKQSFHFKMETIKTEDECNSQEKQRF